MRSPRSSRLPLHGLHLLEALTIGTNGSNVGASVPESVGTCNDLLAFELRKHSLLLIFCGVEVGSSIFCLGGD